MSLAIQVLLLMWVLAGIALFYGASWLLGWKKIHWLDVRKRWLELGLGLVLFFGGLWGVSSITLDVALNAEETEIVQVTEKRGKFPASIVRNSIVTDQGVFLNYFYTFDFPEQGTYQITYLQRSKVILDATKQ